MLTLLCFIEARVILKIINLLDSENGGKRKRKRKRILNFRFEIGRTEKQILAL